MTFIRHYLRLCSEFPVRAALIVAMDGTAGLLEGAALIALVPALEQRLETSRRTLTITDRAAAWLGIAPAYHMHFAFALFFALGLCAPSARFVAESVGIRLRTLVEYRSRMRMSRALLDMQWVHYASLRAGDIGKSLLSEGSYMGLGAQQFLQGIGTALAALIFFLAALVLSPKMTAFAVLFGALGALLYAYGTRLARRHADTLSHLAADIGDQASEVFSNLKFMRATGLTQLAESRGGLIFRRYSDALFRSHFYGRVLQLVFESMGLVFITVLLLVGLFAGGGSVATALVFLALFYRLAPRLMAAQNLWFQARAHLSWYVTWQQRLEEARSHREQPGGTRAPTFQRALRMEGVTLRYPGAAQPALQDVSLEIAQGQCVAVAGASGSGKSTLIDVVTGLLPPQHGTVRLDGADYAALDLEAWRARIGLVLQDTPMFHASILENIAWGLGEPDAERAQRCARMAHALEFIDPLPHGLHTQIGERGAKLSGGQRQRIAIARALYRDPWLLVLDEATSNLDGRSEQRVQAALAGIKGTCAILMVAHRLNTIQFADHIVVLRDGRVVEQGAWSSLVGRPDSALHAMAELQGLMA